MIFEMSFATEKIRAVRRGTARIRQPRITPLWGAISFLPLLAIVPLHLSAVGQEIFRGSSVPTYTDQFSTDCHQGRQPNIYAQLGMNPLACYGQMAPPDSNGQCTMRGMRLLKKVGGYCYYCSPLVPPTKGILIPFDQVGNAQHQGYTCGEDQIDPDCTAICSRTDGSTRYTPPSNTPARINGSNGTPAGMNGPCENYSGLDMTTAKGRQQAYDACSQELCKHNPDLTRCQTPIAPAQPPAPGPIAPLQGSLDNKVLKGNIEVTVVLKGKKKSFFMGVNLGSAFPRGTEGYVVPQRFNNSTLENDPDPDLKKIKGILSNDEKKFIVTGLDFTPQIARYFGQPSYRFPSGSEPVLDLYQPQPGR